MTIYDLAAQYRSDGKARVFVESVWAACKHFSIPEMGGRGHAIEIAYVGIFPEETEPLAWTAAADFTLEHIEKIRQVQEEIENCACGPNAQPWAKRIEVRERAHLDSLCKGVRKEVLK